MINKIYHLPFIFLLLIVNTVTGETLSINVTGIKLNQGEIFIGVFNENKEFPNGEKILRRIIDSDSEVINTKFVLKPGIYAVSIFQDKNQNKLLDTNFFGIPTEKYGFSGKEVLGKPSFEEAALVVKKDQSITIKID